VRRDKDLGVEGPLVVRTFCVTLSSGGGPRPPSNNGPNTAGASPVAGKFSWQPPRNSSNWAIIFVATCHEIHRQLTTVFAPVLEILVQAEAALN
jgi:hypothetical protein